MFDAFGRRIDYLRLSVTDRCNLRCVYCLPPAGHSFRNSREILSDAEILRLVGLMAGMGIKKIRVTGGEPLARPGIAGLIRRLGLTDGIKDVSLSTNGVFFGPMAEELWRCGLRRVNISLDTLDSGKFSRVTRGGKIANVLDSITRAVAMGYEPVKINVVVMRAINDGEIGDFVRLTQEAPLHVRFIELMPIGETGFFSKETRVPLEEIKARCGPLESVPLDDQPRGWGPAAYFRKPGAKGTVGFISALSCNFCGRCNRLRLTAAGELHPCLASPVKIELGNAIRMAAGDEELRRLVSEALRIKPERHQMEGAMVREAFMCSLGG